MKVQTFEEVPSEIKSPAEMHTFFNTRVRGKSAAGHDFPAKLSAEDRKSLLEYLKTL